MLVVRRVAAKGTRASAALTSAETTTALAIAHVLGGGRAPDVLWLGLVALSVYAASRLVLTRRARIRAVLPAMALGQLLLHAWLVTLSSTHAHHSADAGGTFLGLTGPMLLAHLVAGAVTTLAWALRRRAVDVLLDWQGLPAPVVERPQPVATTAPTPKRAALRLSAPTRGPPRGLPAAA